MIKNLPYFLWIFSIIVTGCSPAVQKTIPPEFTGANAFEHVKYQVALGPRVPGTPAHTKCIDWIAQNMQSSGWIVERQKTLHKQLEITNIVTKNKTGDPDILIGAHFDSRMLADQDPDPANRIKPVPGANDGASGVAVLLELARVLPSNIPKVIWFVFFDAEDQGNINNLDWILGSRIFAKSLTVKPKQVIILDMIGDSSLNLHYERSSNIELSRSIWAKAAELGFQNQFIPTPKHSILDDHTPFLELGIPSIDIIDFDYPYWHTVSDTVDRVSIESLEAVGKTMYGCLMDQK